MPLDLIVMVLVCSIWSYLSVHVVLIVGNLFRPQASLNLTKASPVLPYVWQHVFN